MVYIRNGTRRSLLLMIHLTWRMQCTLIGSLIDGGNGVCQLNAIKAYIPINKRRISVNSIEMNFVDKVSAELRSLKNAVNKQLHDPPTTAHLSAFCNYTRPQSLTALSIFLISYSRSAL